MKKILICLLGLWCSPSLFAQPHSFTFKSGDLLFQDLDCGALCDAIEAVTPAVNGKHFSHIGLVYVKQDSVFVIEAIGKDVHLTPVQQFLNRNLKKGQPAIVVGRLKPTYTSLNEKAIRFALSQIGTPYDDTFLYNNGKYYCSELLYDAYQWAYHQKPFFRLQPMTFKDPATGHYFPAWQSYYEKLNMTVPEGKPGCNPGSIANDPKVTIVYSFY